MSSQRIISLSIRDGLIVVQINDQNTRKYFFFIKHNVIWIDHYLKKYLLFRYSFVKVKKSEYILNVEIKNCPPFIGVYLRSR